MKHQTSSLQLCGQPTILTLTQSTARFEELQRVYSQIRDVDQLKSRQIEEWEHFHQVVIDEAVRYVFELVLNILNADFRVC